MEPERISAQLKSLTSRREVVKTGVKLGYAVPIVAASFQLTAQGTLAAICPDGYEEVDLAVENRCCRCDGVLHNIHPIVIGNSAKCQDPGDPDFVIDATCTGVLGVSPA
jgi:hypothetical protein